MKLSETLNAAFGYGWNELPTFRIIEDFEITDIASIVVYPRNPQQGRILDVMHILGESKPLGYIQSGQTNAIDWFDNYLKMVKNNG